MEPNTQELREKIGGSFEKAIATEEVEKNTDAVELIQTVVDAIDLANEGSIWEQKTQMAIILPPNETILPYGTGVNFIPVHGSTDADWKAMITLSKEEKNPVVGGSVFIEGTKEPNGNKVKSAKMSGTELSTKQILFGIASLGMSALSRVEES